MKNEGSFFFKKIAEFVIDCFKEALTKPDPQVIANKKKAKEFPGTVPPYLPRH